MSVTILHLDTCYPSYVHGLACDTINGLYSVHVDDKTTVEEVYLRLEREVDGGPELHDAIAQRIASTPGGGKYPFDERVERDCNQPLDECVHAYFVVIE